MLHIIIVVLVVFLIAPDSAWAIHLTQSAATHHSTILSFIAVELGIFMLLMGVQEL